MITLVALYTGLGLLWAALLLRRLEKENKELTVELGRVREEFWMLHNRVGEFDKFFHYGVAVDTNLHDRGWIIMVASVGGRDFVKIQQTKRHMSPKEYRELVMDIEHAGRHVAYVDAPLGYNDLIKKGRRW